MTQTLKCIDIYDVIIKKTFLIIFSQKKSR